MILNLLASLTRLDEGDLAHVFGGTGSIAGSGTADPEPSPWRTGRGGTTSHT